MGFFDKNQPPKTPADPNADALKQLADSMQQLTSSMPQMIAQAVAQSMGQVVSRLPQQQAPVKQDPPAPKLPTPDEINELDNAGLLRLIVEAVDQKLNQASSVVESKLGEVSSKLTTSDLKSRVKEVMTANPDFMEYRDVMASLAKRHPDLDPEDLYNLAKVKAPEIGQRLEEQRQQEEEEKRKHEQAAPFGGLTPTSTLRGDDAEASSKDFKTASEDAWDKVMSQLPPEIIGGSNN